jgi:hypothetical protein
MSELSALAGSERYGVCEDEVALSSISVNTEMAPPEAGQFRLQEGYM